MSKTMNRRTFLRNTGISVAGASMMQPLRPKISISIYGWARHLKFRLSIHVLFTISGGTTPIPAVY